MSGNPYAPEDGAAPMSQSVRVVLRDAAGLILMLKRPVDAKVWPDVWSFPGGIREPGESWQQAAQRELLEETGLSAQLSSPPVAYAHGSGYGMAFEGREQSGELRTNDESAEVGWFSPTELPVRLMGSCLGILEAMGIEANCCEPEPAALPAPGSELLSSLLSGPKTPEALAAIGALVAAGIEVMDGSPVLLGEVREDAYEAGPPRRTTEGFVTFDAWATRIGVFNYMTKDGTVRRELRLPEHVFDPKSMETLASKPVTDEHPPELLTAETAARHTRGWTGERVRRDGDKLAATATIIDAQLAGKVIRGEAVQVSCGYACDLVVQSGEWRGEEYDAIQTNIKYNHLAVVPRGRAGPEVKLRTDSDAPEGGGRTMTKVNIDGVEIEVSEAAAIAIKGHMDARKTKQQQMQEEMDAKKAALDKLQAEYDGMKASLDKMQAKCDAAEDKVKELEAARQDAASLQALVDARIKLVERAKALAPDAKFDGLTDIQVMTVALEAAVPGVKLDGKSADYVEARFDAALGSAPAQNPAAAIDRKSTRLNSSHTDISRMPSSA